MVVACMGALTVTYQSLQVIQRFQLPPYCLGGQFTVEGGAQLVMDEHHLEMFVHT